MVIQKTIKECEEELAIARDQVLQVTGKDKVEAIDRYLDAKIEYILRKKNLYYGAW